MSSSSCANRTGNRCCSVQCLCAWDVRTATKEARRKPLRHRRKLCPSTARARQLNPASDAHFPAACNYGGPSGARRRPRHRPPYSVAASPSRPWGDGRLTFLFFDMLLSIAAMVTGERLVLLARGEREKSGKPRLQSILSYNRRLFALSPETFEENVHFGSWGA